MRPSALAALPANPLSAARTLMDRMHRERWRIERVRCDLNDRGDGVLVYRIEAGSHVLSAVAFSSEPAKVNRTPRIIGSSWDVIGALMEGEPDDARIEQTRREIPRLYAGRAPESTLIWFRANRSMRVFDRVVDALADNRLPSTEEIGESGYLVRNTGLDGNGTFGTKDFAAYGSDHPLALPYHAQMLSAYMMREISFDLVEGVAKARSAQAAVLPEEVKRRIAVGNGSALGLVLFFMNRPRLVSKWIQLYEESSTQALNRRWPTDAAELNLFDDLLSRTIDEREADGRPYRLFPSGPRIAVGLKELRRSLRAARAHEERGITLAGVLAGAPGLLPEAEELFRSLALELDRDAWEPRLGELAVDECVRPDPTWTAGRLRGELESAGAWWHRYPRNPPALRNRVWYKSRASEEPRSGHRSEIPDGTHDLAYNPVEAFAALSAALDSVPDAASVGDVLLAHPEVTRAAGLAQHLTTSPYALARTDFRDDELIPIYLIHVLNAFCFGLEKTVDVQRRTLRGLIFEHAPTRHAIGADGTGHWWAGGGR